MLDTLKIEFRATPRSIFLGYIVIILLAVLNRFFAQTVGENPIDEFFSFFYVGAIAIVAILTATLIIKRFYVSLRNPAALSSVSIDILIGSKLIAAFCWVFTAFFLTGISGLILGRNSWILDVVPFDFLIFFRFFEHQGTALILSALGGLISLFALILGIYSAMSVGMLVNRFRVLFGLLVYVVLFYLFIFAIDFYADMIGSDIGALGVFFAGGLVQSSLYYFMTRWSILRRVRRISQE